MKPKLLTVGDLRTAIPDVAFEMATREAIWSACLNNSTMYTALPEMDEPQPPEHGESEEDDETEIKVHTTSYFVW